MYTIPEQTNFIGDTYFKFGDTHQISLKNIVYVSFETRGKRRTVEVRYTKKYKQGKHERFILNNHYTACYIRDGFLCFVDD